MRRPVKNRNIPKPDQKYNSDSVGKLINYIMVRGQKETARKVVYDAFEKIKEKESVEDPLPIFEEAIKNASPSVEVRSRRVGGANYQVPREVRDIRRLALAFRWIIAAARGRQGSSMADRLAEELILASKGEGTAVKKKEDTHRMAEANRAFAHFAW